MSNPIEVVLKFEQAINSRNAEAVCAMLTPDSVFIDSLGNRITDQGKMRPAWEGYFKMVPDYSISHSEIFANGDTVALFGSAQGTFSKDGKLNKGEADLRAEPVDGSARSSGILHHSSAGGSEATRNENSWTMPAAWRAVVKDGKIALWQIFADNEPIRAIMRKNS